ncbi:hypothetical protein [Methylobacterium trifolii]|uniref:Uncharacterized protein n=1 Tax=Methylobacterium trifolii TaxID=1003092 RepID=A0ABQ4TUB8_9HYPH|nr:hypothetical protein [Methylobacterium trifolii]GJE58904.1 hypothetical protein MPOCJGCO_0989 [Methylobacterium trifolii]
MRRPALRAGHFAVPVAALLALAPQPGLAQGRPDITTMTCAAAAGLVARSGAVVMTTGPGTYARIVRDAGFCTIETSTRPDFEAARDDPRCFVGYACVDPFSEGRDGP